MAHGTMVAEVMKCAALVGGFASVSSTMETKGLKNSEQRN